MNILKQHNVDCYIGLQLICTLKWKDNFKLGYDQSKYSFFISNYNPTEKIFLQPIIEKMDRELDRNNLWELLNEYASLIPQEFRYETWKRCNAIINSYAPLQRMDIKILTIIESKLKITEELKYR